MIKVPNRALVLIAMATVLVTGCGLAGDLYLPTEEPATAPAENQAAGDQSTDEKNTAEEATADSQSAATP